MARGGLIDNLGIRNFSVGEDSIIVKYDDSKCDKAGDRLSEKNIFANTENWEMCVWTGIGVWCALNQEHLVESGNIFFKKETKEGTASGKYCEQLLGIVKKHKSEVSTLMMLEHFDPYGWRKGSATYAVSGTTVSPSVPSIARRGEWSIGSVLDLYWHFGSVGDQYLGRVLTGINPDSPFFDLLPPHWNITNPMSNKFVMEGMEMTFGKIQPEFRPICIRAFACMVYHSDDLIKKMIEIPGHDFSKLVFLHKKELCTELKKLVSTEPTTGGMSRATGIPPHIAHTRELCKVLEEVKGLTQAFGKQTEELVGKVCEAIDQKAFDQGNITSDRLKSLLEENKKKRELEKWWRS